MTFGMKTKNSKELFKKSKEHIAGGVNSQLELLKVLEELQYFSENHEIVICMMKMEINI